MGHPNCDCQSPGVPPGVASEEGGLLESNELFGPEPSAEEIVIRVHKVGEEDHPDHSPFGAGDVDCHWVARGRQTDKRNPLLVLPGAEGVRVDRGGGEGEEGVGFVRVRLIYDDDGDDVKLKVKWISLFWWAVLPGCFGGTSWGSRRVRFRFLIGTWRPCPLRGRLCVFRV